MSAQSRSAYRACIAADRARLVAHVRAQMGVDPPFLWSHPGWLAVRLYRAANRAWVLGRRKRARAIYQLGCLLTGVDIHPNASVGPGLLIAAPCGVNLSGVAGANTTFMPRSGMGIIPSVRDVGAGQGLPVLGNDVLMASAAGPLGAVRLGNGSMIGPRSFRPRDVGEGIIAERACACEIVPRSSCATDQKLAAVDGRRGDRSCLHRSLGMTLSAIVADLARHHKERTGSDTLPGAGAKLSALLSNVCLALALHRLAHWLWLRRLTPLASILSGVARGLFKCSIDMRSCLGGGCFLPHPAGVLIRARAGERLTVYADGVITPREIDGGRPELGDDVIVGGQAMALGGVKVGDHARIAAMVTLNTDLPAGATAMSDVIRFAERPRKPFASSSAGERAKLLAPRRALRTADRRRLAEVMNRQGRLQSVLLRLSAANLAVGLFRMAEAAHADGRPARAQFIRQLNALLTGADLDPRSRVGPGLVIPYPAGVSMYARAGRDLTIMAMAGIDADPERSASPASIGDRVKIGHHALVWGPVKIGTGALIESGALASADVPSEMCVRAPEVRVRGGVP